MILLILTSLSLLLTLLSAVISLLPLLTLLLTSSLTLRESEFADSKELEFGSSSSWLSRKSHRTLKLTATSIEATGSTAPEARGEGADTTTPTPGSGAATPSV